MLSVVADSPIMKRCAVKLGRLDARLNPFRAVFDYRDYYGRQRRDDSQYALERSPSGSVELSADLDLGGDNAGWALRAPANHPHFFVGFVVILIYTFALIVKRRNPGFRDGKRWAAPSFYVGGPICFRKPHRKMMSDASVFVSLILAFTLQLRFNATTFATMNKDTDLP
jgi:hypothetical protein